MTAAPKTSPAELGNPAEPASLPVAHPMSKPGADRGEGGGRRETVRHWTHIERAGAERLVEARLVFEGDEVTELAWRFVDSLIEHPFRDEDEAARVVMEVCGHG